MADILQDYNMMIGEELGKSFGVSGWEYRDLPRMTMSLMEEFMALVGEENLKFITFAQYPDEQHGQCVRGQVLISPEGMDRIKARAKA